MKNPLFTVTFNKIMQGANYTVFILSAQAKKFPIYTSPEVGHSVSRFLADKSSPRPQTHDLINSLFNGFSIHPLQLLIHDLDDTVYFCKLLVEQTNGDEQQILNIDARPSDGLVLALSHNLPIYCSQTLIDKLPEFTEPTA